MGETLTVTREQLKRMSPRQRYHLAAEEFRRMKAAGLDLEAAVPGDVASEISAHTGIDFESASLVAYYMLSTSRDQ